MNQADVSKLVSQLRISIGHSHRRLKNVDGPEGRLLKLRKTVTALIKHERLELYHNRGDEARAYAERLISDAIRYGDCHNATMEMADFWILEKQYVHKLFKVLVPRYENWNLSYTRMYKAPRVYSGPRYQYLDRAILELRGNPYPSVKPDMIDNRSLIHNVLLDEAKRAYRKEKYAEIAAKLIPPTIHQTDKLQTNAIESMPPPPSSSSSSVEEQNTDSTHISDSQKPKNH